jgi:hypothetical protein
MLRLGGTPPNRLSNAPLAASARHRIAQGSPSALGLRLDTTDRAQRRRPSGPGASATLKQLAAPQSVLPDLNSSAAGFLSVVSSARPPHRDRPLYPTGAGDDPTAVDGVREQRARPPPPSPGSSTPAKPHANHGRRRPPTCQQCLPPAGHCRQPWATPVSLSRGAEATGHLLIRLDRLHTNDETD